MSNIQVQFWGFQGQNEGYSNCIWQTDVLSSTDLLKLIPKDHREEYKQMVPRGLGWRFDSSGSQIAVTCLRMIELAKSEADFFAGTIVFPRGTVATQHQLDQLAAYVKEAGDTLEQHRKQTRLSHMGPLGGEPHVIDAKEMLEASREFIVLPLDRSKFTLGGLIRKLAELRQPELSVFIVDQPEGELSPNDGLEVIQNAVQSLAAASSVSVKTSFDEVQSADDQRYQELLEYRAEQKRIAEEKERARLAREAEEERRRQEQERQRKRRQAQFFEFLKKASKGLGVLAVVAGLSYGAYQMKDEAIDLVQSVFPDAGKKAPPTKADIEPAIEIQNLGDTTVVKEISWSSKPNILRQIFHFDGEYSNDSIDLHNLQNPLPDLKLFIHESDSALHGIAIEFSGESTRLGPVDTIQLKSSEFPGLPVSELILILKKEEDDIKQDSLQLEQGSSPSDSATTTVDTP